MINLKNSKLPITLFHTLNFTKTRSGMRMLKANILQPPCGKFTYISIHIIDHWQRNCPDLEDKIGFSSFLNSFYVKRP
jgi:hypothetical protein